ncbi:MAG: zinc ribbon domain-containing protein [Candidatus Odinarchaeota archaeon]
MPETEREELITCNNCNQRVPKRPFCINCGISLEKENNASLDEKQASEKNKTEPVHYNGTKPGEISTRTCPSCGKPVSSKFDFCIYCGSDLQKKPASMKYELTGTKSCPYCKQNFKGDLRYCISCGRPLINISLKPQRESRPEITSTPFTGFSVPILTTGSKMTALGSDESIGIAGTPSVSILRPSFQTTPADSRTSMSSSSLKAKSVKSLLFTVTAPQRLSSTESFKKSFLVSFKGYVLTAVFVFFVYVFWYFFFFESSVLFSLISLNFVDPFPLEKIVTIVLLSIPNSLFVTIMLLLPVITLSHKTYYKHEITVVYNIEPAIIILTIFTNIIITALQLFIPLIMLPGDIKMKQLPPKREIGKGLGRGVTACVLATAILGIVVFITIGGLPASIEPTSLHVILKSAQITFIMSSWVCLITLLPFGNVLGKMVQEWNFRRFLLLLSISAALILYSVALAGLYRQTGV